MGNGSKIVVLHPIDVEGSDPPTIAGVAQFYAKISSGIVKFYMKDSAGTVTEVGAGGSVGAKVGRLANQSIPSAVSTAISFDTEEWDDSNFFAIGTPTHLVIPSTGKYLLCGNWLHNDATPCHIFLRFNVNGVQIQEQIIAFTADEGMSLCSAVELSLVAADVVTMMIFHDSPGPVNYQATCSIRKVG